MGIATTVHGERLHVRAGDKLRIRQLNIHDPPPFLGSILLCAFSGEVCRVTAVRDTAVDLDIGGMSIGHKFLTDRYFERVDG